MRIQRLGFGDDAVEYHHGWDTQRRLHAGVADGTEPSTMLILEHQPVYTAGKRTRDHERPVTGAPVVDIDRGGKITWHGPGQIVGYPLIKLRDPIDVVAYVRHLEELLMRVCERFDVATMRVGGRSGVWVAADERRPERKISAIGVRVAKGVTMHGFALNCNNSLDAYHDIVPCGITDAGVTTLSTECGRDVPVAEVLPVVEDIMRTGLDDLVEPAAATQKEEATV